MHIEDDMNTTLSTSDLEAAGLTSAAIKKAVVRKSIAAVGRGEYNYQSLPESWQEKVRRHFWEGLTPSEWQAVRAKREAKAACEGLDTILEDVLTGGYAMHLSAYMDRGEGDMHQARRLAQGAAGLERIAGWLRAQGANSKKLGLVEQAAEAVRVAQVPYLPENARRLQQKLRELEAGKKASDIIRLPRVGNNNAAVHKVDEDINAWALALRAQGANYTNALIIRHLTTLCGQLGKKAPSEGWFKAFFAQHSTKFLSAGGRFNEGGRHGAAYMGYTPTRTALFAGDCWQMDGSRVNLMAHKADPEHRVIAGRKEQYVYIIAVRDVHSGMVVGCHLDYKEDRWGYLSALRSAVENTGYLPYEVMHDQFPGHNTPEWKQLSAQIKDVGVKVTLARTAQAKAQMERWFGSWQDCFMQTSAYYYGQGVKSSLPHAHRSETYLKQLQRNTRQQDGEQWGWREAMAETAELVSMYNTTLMSAWSRKHKAVTLSPEGLHGASEKPHVAAVSERMWAQLFGEKRHGALRSGFVMLQVDGRPVRLAVDERAQLRQGLDVYAVLRDYSGSTLEVHLEAGERSGWLYCRATGACLGRAFEELGVLVHGPAAEHGRVEQITAARKRINQARKKELGMAKERAAGLGDELSPSRRLAGRQEGEEALLMPRNTSKDVAERVEDTLTPGRSGGWHPYDAEEEGGILE